MGQGNILDQREDKRPKVGFWRHPNVHRLAAIPQARSPRSSVGLGRAACAGGSALRIYSETAVNAHVLVRQLGTLAGATASKVR